MSKKKKSPENAGSEDKKRQDEQESTAVDQMVNDLAEVEPAAFSIVGIGASAGGLQAFESLFSHMPVDSGMAFVIVQHLDPTHESILADLLGRFTDMPVTKVVDNMAVRPNNVYVIPPAADMELRDRKLRLTRPSKPRGFRLPIDIFFRSLAMDQAERAICIILSGTGTDGTLGLKAIKEAGGLAVVQAPETTRYDGMPVSAISTGLVDLVLPPEKIAEQLVKIIDHSFEYIAEKPQQLTSEINKQLQRIFFLLKNQTGHDFSGYKENTITRRIRRRMSVNHISKIEDYLGYLQETPVEVQKLFRELLIGVTSFFRDPEAFDNLKEIVVKPLSSDQWERSGQIRVWVPGCSTGEEAYTIAILLHEQVEQSGKPVEIQIFATDIDQAAINSARDGRYPKSIVVDVSPERLERYFNLEDDGETYRVNRQVREMVVFATQSVIKDPPFSRLDLICCRNLMIYLGPELQKRLLSIFHYALNSGGFLFLGNSETLGQSQKLFQTLDPKWKIFKRSEYVSEFRTVIDFSGQINQQRKPLGIVPIQPTNARELTEELLLTEYTPTSVLINEKGDMLYIHGQTGKYLEQSTGEASTNILQIARRGLRMPLSSAVRNANAQKKTQALEGILVENEAGIIHVNLTVAPVIKPNIDEELMLVTFTELPTPRTIGEAKRDGVDYTQTQHITELEQELKSTREYLQTVIEELETTNEELKSANEELQSANEELQSTNEELQTSKEELQSVNEELVTVNTELQARVEELTVANNDIKNLLDNIQVGIIFLDINLRIRRFTPASAGMVDLIPADIGRPLAQFVHKLQYDELVQDARETLDTLSLKELEVQNRDGNWFLLRFLPYYTIEHEVDGVVLTITDITEIKRVQENLREREFLWRSLAENFPNVYLSIIEDNMTASYSAGLEFTKQGLDPEFYNGLSLKEVFGDQAGVVRTHYEQAFAGIPQEFELFIYDQYQLYRVTPLPAGDGSIPRILSVVENITERKMAEKALADSLNQYQIVVEASHDGIVQNDMDGNIVAVNSNFVDLFGFENEHEIIEGGITTFDLLAPEVRETVMERAAPVFESDQIRGVEMKVVKRDGTRFDAEFNTTLVRDEKGNPLTLVTFVRDITDRKQMMASLRESEQTYRMLVDSIPNTSIHLVDRNLRYLVTGGSELKKNNFDKSQVEGRTLREAFPKDVADLFEPIFYKAFEGEITEFEMSYSPYHYNQQVLPVQDEDGRIFAAIHISINITERKEWEEALQASESRLSLARTAGKIGIWDWDLEKNSLLWDERMYEIYGIDPETFGGAYEAWQQGVHPDDLPEAEAAVKQAIEEVGEFHYEFRIVRPSGEVRYVESHALVIYSDDGQPQKMVGVNLDITERKQAEEALRKSEAEEKARAQELETLLDAVPAIVWVAHDPDGQKITGNRAASEFLQMPPDANQSITADPDERPRHFTVWKDGKELTTEELPVQLAAQGKIITDFEEEVVFDDGFRHQLIGNASPLYDEHGNVRGAVGAFQDITKLKKAEEALRESEERFRAMVNSMDDVIFTLDTEQRHTGVYGDWVNRVGLTPEFFLGKTTREILGEEAAMVHEPPTRQALAGERVTYQWSAPVGEKLHHYQTSLSPIHNEDGELYGLVGVGRDVTELKQAEEAVLASQKLLQDIVNNTPALIYMADTEGRMVMANRQVEELFGIPGEAMVGKLRHDFMPEEMATPHRNNDLAVIESRTAHNFIEENIEEDGIQYFLTTKFPLFNNDNEVYAICGISVDITERRRAEEALRASEIRAKALLNAVPDLIFRLDRQGVFLDYKAERSDLHTQSNSLVGQRNRDLTPPAFADLIEQKIEATLETAEMQLFEYQLPIPGRGVRDYEARMVVSGADEVTAIVRDVTESKRIQKERLAQEMQMLEDQRLKSLGLLAGGVAHDINNLLTPISLNMEMLLMSHAETPKARRLLTSVEDMAQKISDIVQQMLVYAGHAEPALGEMDMNELVNNISTLLQASLPKKSQLQLDLSAEPLPMAGDPTQLEQVLMNLIINASEAYEGQVGQIFVTTRYEDSTGREEVIVTVRDTGPGIDPEVLPSIFDPFFSTKAAGRGLGLSAVKGIIHAHEGEITVESVVGEGTMFTIRLPLAGLKAESKQPSKLTFSPSLASEALWLIIDDEEIIRNATAEVFEALGLQMIQAPNGEVGLEMVAENAAELTGVLLDLTMPGMNGREVLEQLRVDYPDLPVLLASGYSEQEVQDLLTDPNVAFVSKPFKIQDLQGAMRSLIE